MWRRIGLLVCAASALFGCSGGDRVREVDSSVPREDEKSVSSSPAPADDALTVTVRSDGVAFAVGRETIGRGCTGSDGVTVPRAAEQEHDFGAVRTCARTLKGRAALADVVGVSVTAESGVRYQEIITLLDALRSDPGGDLFPEFVFAAPHGAPVPSSNSQARSPATSAPMAISTPSESGVVLRISKSQITVGDEAQPVVTYDGFASMRENGIDAVHKRSGQADYFIVPLGATLATYRAADKRFREAKGLDASTSELILVADQEVPYRVLFEVLHTAGASEFGKYHLLLRTRG